MSASTPAPAVERTEWHGEDVAAEQLAERLLQMNRDHARHEHSHAATRTLNLLVAAGADVPPGGLAARLSGLSARHPSRTIVLREHAPQRLDATLAIDCTVGCGPEGAGCCHDSAELVADAARLGHADSLVRPLRVAGLPTVLWLPGAQPSAAERSLAPTVEAIVLDSGAASDLGAAFARADALGAARVRDLAWLRMRRWRQRVATHFDEPAERALLPAVERIELRCGPRDMASALLLAGWIVARAGWPLAQLSEAGGCWSGSAQRPQGEAIAVVLCPPSGAMPGVEALTLHAGTQKIELVEPVAEPDAARAFAAALRTFDEPAPGYDVALAALLQAIGER